MDELPWQDNSLCEITVAGRTICLVRNGQTVRACAAKCPHAGGRIAQGFCSAAGHLVCPLHRYRFDPATGRNVSGEGYHLRTYPVELREEGVFVGLEEAGLFGWFR